MYVADTLGKSVHVFERNPSTNDLKRVHVVDVRHAPDNVKYDNETRTIVTGSVYNIHGVFPMKASYPKLSPKTYGAVTQIKFNALLGEWLIRDLVISNKLNGVSNGLIMGNKVIFGSFLYPGVLICPLNAEIPKIVARNYMFNKSVLHTYDEL